MTRWFGGLRRRALLAIAIAMLGVGIAGLAALSEEPSKPGPIPRPEGVLASASSGTLETVPARAPAPPGVACPADWSYFDNPALHYGVCVPPGWGFSDFRTAAPLDQIPSVQLENLHLLGNAFPWHPGTLPFDAVRRGAFDVELNVLPEGASAVDECEPSIPKLLGVLPVLTCEQLYGDDGLPALLGSLRAIKIIVPLQTAPAGEPGARLLIIARARIGASLAEVTTLWQIAQHVHPY